MYKRQALGAPSVALGGSRIGALDILRPERGEAVEITEATAESVADAIESVLHSNAEIEEVGRAARRRALAWTEETNGNAWRNLLLGVRRQDASRAAGG